MTLPESQAQAQVIIDLLRDELADHLILRSRPAKWPPRLCDLTPLDYFLWGYVNAHN